MPKHAPVQLVCFWCHNKLELITEEEGIEFDLSLPTVESYASYNHCPNCESQWQGMITAIEVVEQPCSPGQPPIDDKDMFYPTRNRVAINPTAYLLLMASSEPRPPAQAVAEAINMGEFLVPPQTFKVICDALHKMDKAVEVIDGAAINNAVIH